LYEYDDGKIFPNRVLNLIIKGARGETDLAPDGQKYNTHAVCELGKPMYGMLMSLGIPWQSIPSNARKGFKPLAIEKDGKVVMLIAPTMWKGKDGTYNSKM
jgi:hypothetical protein